MASSLRVLDLFAGCGGFSQGFREAGIEPVRAIENFKPVAASYAENFPDVDLTVDAIQRVAPGDPVDVIIGGPPCEPYTSASTARETNPLDRLYKDKIGRLVLEFIRFVRELRPKAFVMENVIQVAEPPLDAALAKEFRDAGYANVHFHELVAEDYGAPSHRRRMFISNLRLDPLKSGRPPPTVAQVLAGLPRPGTTRDVNHLPHPLSGDKLERIQRLAPGRSLYSYRSGTGKVHGNWWRLSSTQLAPTVTGHARFVHPTQDRLLTVREHARLMGFPDSFVFRGGRDLQYDQVGEAVPPPLARAIAGALLRACG